MSSHQVFRNLGPAELSELAIRTEEGSNLTSTGALSVRSGEKTGRSPKDKRIVDDPPVHDEVDWGSVNMPMTDDAFMKIRRQAKNFLDAQPRVYVMDLFCGWDPKYRMKVRVITTRAYHALFMHNMLIRPTKAELENYGNPHYTIYNAGCCDADQTVEGVDSKTCVALSLTRNEQVILGTQYAGEMKKGMLTVMMYLMAKQGHLCMHASANESMEHRDTTVFFGLSGTGKTTLSADPNRYLIGDDEHVWTDHGVFNVEGGCYAKAIGLSLKSEPDIFRAVRFGAVMENCVMNKDRVINYDDKSITENTRVAYPLEHIPNAKLPSLTGHPNNVIFLTNDAYGVLPPVSKLTLAQAMFWFITGYTAKVPGTETGVVKPIPTFSPCFGGPFLVWHPTVYGKQLAEKLEKHDAHCWLVNTGWSGGPYSVGQRMSLKITRSIIDGIHDGHLAKVEYETMPGWGLEIPKSCNKVPSDLLNPINTWASKKDYVQTVNHLGHLFRKNFEKFESKATPEMLDAMPKTYPMPSQI